MEVDNVISDLVNALRLCECELSTYRILSEQSSNPQAWHDAIKAARAAMVKGVEFQKQAKKA